MTVPLIGRLAFLSAIALTITPSLHAEEQSSEADAIAIQNAREGRVTARGERRHYDKHWDLSAIPSYRPATKITGKIRIYGLNYLTDGKLAGYWEAGFKKFHPEATFEWNTPTALVAIPGLYFGLADIGASRKITFDDILAFQRIKGRHPLEIAAVTGSFNVPGWAPSLGIFVHKSNPIAKLSFDQLDGIYGAERAGGFDGVTWHDDAARGPEKNIRNWGQLGLSGDWANKPIHPYGRPLKYHQQLRIERQVFKGGSKWTESLREFAHAVKADGTQAVSTGSMLDALAADPLGIAFADLEAADQNPDVKLVAISRGPNGPWVMPTLETSRDRSYPFHGESYLYIDREPGKPIDPKVKEFLTYVLSREGQEAVQEDAKFLPLTPDVAQQERSKLD